MAYIGNQAATAFTSFDKQIITGNNGTVYTLSHAVASEQELEVFVNNVRQEGGVGKAFTVSGNQITFTGAVASSDSCYVNFQGKAIQTVVPPDGSVTDAKISAMAASKLTGALPALDGSALTGLTAAGNVDYVEGTFTPLCFKGTGQVTSATQAQGTYIRFGKMLFVTWYFYKSAGSNSTSGSWTIKGIPFSLAAGLPYYSVRSTYFGINGTSYNGDHRWQSNAADALTCYGSQGQQNWTSSYIEMSGSGMLRIA